MARRSRRRSRKKPEGVEQETPVLQAAEYPEDSLDGDGLPTAQNGFSVHNEYFPVTELALAATRPLKVAGALVGGNTTCIMAGPPFVESVDVAHAACQVLQDLEIQFIRSKAFWPWARSVDFQRHLRSGLEVLSTAATNAGLRLVSEIVNSRDVELMAHFCDVLEVGIDNCFNTSLLREVAISGRCVMLNRHPRMTHEAFLDVVAQLDEFGAGDVILVDNGVRRGDGPGENVLDIAGLVRLKRDTRCPVMVAVPSLVSDWSYVTETAVAAVAAGVDGVITDMVPDPCFIAQNPKALLPGHLRALVGRVTALKCTLNAVNLQELQNR